MGDKGEGGAKNLKKWVTGFMDYVNLQICFCIRYAFRIDLNNNTSFLQLKYEYHGHQESKKYIDELRLIFFSGLIINLGLKK